MKRYREYRYDFMGAGVPPTSSPPGPFIRAASGSGAAAALSDGGLALSFDNTSEVARQAIYFNDHLAFDIDRLIRCSMIVKMASVGANVICAMGLTSAFNATVDSITEAAIFRVEGDDDLLVETDDGTNNNDDIDTGLNNTADWMELVIDFSTGVQSRSGRASLGGKGAVKFLAGNAGGALRPVAQSTLFDMSNYSGGLQLFAQIQKASSTATGTLTIREFCVEYKDN